MEPTEKIDSISKLVFFFSCFGGGVGPSFFLLPNEVDCPCMDTTELVKIEAQSFIHSKFG